jgi:hypothetical protein
MPDSTLSKSTQYLRNWRGLFGHLFAISLLCYFLASVVGGLIEPSHFPSGTPPEPTPTPLPTPIVTSVPPAHPWIANITLLVSVASLITGIASLIGIVSTTILGWRKEIREARTFAIDNEKKELEIAKLRAELAKKNEEEQVTSLEPPPDTPKP